MVSRRPFASKSSRKPSAVWRIDIDAAHLTLKTAVADMLAIRGVEVDAIALAGEGEEVSQEGQSNH